MFGYYSTAENFKEENGYIIDDIWYPRVTKIVSIKAKPALYSFYGEAASFKAAAAITEKSAEEGTLIHEAVEKLILGEKPEISPQIAPAINSFLRFKEEKSIQVSPDLIEKRV